MTDISPYWSIPDDKHPPIVQVLNGHEAWRRCTPRQRDILRAARVLINGFEKEAHKRWAVRAHIDAPTRTVDSMRTKGLADEHGNLTLVGAWGVLFGPDLEEMDAKRKAERTQHA